MRLGYCLILLFAASHANAGIVRQNVRHLSKSGSTGLIGDVTLSEGSGITLTQINQNITISASGGSAGSLSISSKVANYTLTNSDDVIIADTTAGPFTITAHASASATIKPYRIKVIGNYPVTLAATGADTIDNETTQLLEPENAAVPLIPDGGTNWYVF